MEKFKMFLKKSAILCCALMAAPMAAMAEETTSDATSTMVDALVAKVDFSSVQTGIVTVAGGLIAVYLGLLAFRFLKGMVRAGKSKGNSHDIYLVVHNIF